MDFTTMVQRNRSYRRFSEDQRVPMHTLESLVDLARQTPSGANLQPLRYTLVSSREMCDAVFPCLGWAGYLPHWKGPDEGERPAAYIVILADAAIEADVKTDSGIAAQTIMLGAVERGLGGCMLGAVNRDKLRGVLNVDEAFEIVLVLAIGRPVEQVTIEPLGEDGGIKYWRDADNGHHVPKRALEDIIVARHK